MKPQSFFVTCEKASWFHLRSSGLIWDQLESSGIWDHLCDHLGHMDHLAAPGTIWGDIGRVSGTPLGGLWEKFRTLKQLWDLQDLPRGLGSKIAILLS